MIYDFESIKKKFLEGEYAISDHAIIEARKDGIEPNTIEKLEWIVVNGKVIEEYPERKRILVFAILEGDRLPVHVVVDFSAADEPVLVTSYVPESRYWIQSKKRKK